MTQQSVSINLQSEQSSRSPLHFSVIDLKAGVQEKEQNLNNTSVKQDSQLNSFLSAQNAEETQRKIEDVQKQIDQMYEVLPPVNNFFKFCFMMFGILAFAGWNAVITAFDFFSVRYPKEDIPDVTFYFPFGVMVGDLLSGITFVAQAKYFSVRSRFMYTVVIEVVVIISICIVAMVYNVHLL